MGRPRHDVCELLHRHLPVGRHPGRRSQLRPNYVDTTNGGCNSDPNNPAAKIKTLTCGQTVCGTAGTYLNGTTQARDTDWYRVSLTAPGILVASLDAEFRSTMSI